MRSNLSRNYYGIIIKTKLAVSFNYSFRHINDVLSINIYDFHYYVHKIYGNELEIKEVTKSAIGGSEIDPPHPLVCCKRLLNGIVRRRRPEQIEAPCHSRCCTIKTPPCSKALSAEHRPNFCSPSPVKVTSPYN
jgi:hypothetical protein